jgi:hypothetical protein
MKRPIKIILMLIAVFLISWFILMPLGRRGLRNWLDSSSFGRISIKLADGSKVYVVRESWGRHTDEISIRHDSDGCRVAEPKTDYIDVEQNGNALVYRVTGSGLLIYSDPPPYKILSPTGRWNSNRPTILPTKQPAWIEMLQHPEQYNVVALHVPLNEMCLVNLFRHENSLRDRPKEP